MIKFLFVIPASPPPLSVCKCVSTTQFHTSYRIHPAANKENWKRARFSSVEKPWLNILLRHLAWTYSLLRRAVVSYHVMISQRFLFLGFPFAVILILQVLVTSTGAFGGSETQGEGDEIRKMRKMLDGYQKTSFLALKMIFDQEQSCTPSPTCTKSRKCNRA